METIKSFTVDHKRLLPGVYVSRKDSTGHDVVTTFDIRTKLPNREPVMNIAEIHTIEHLAATFLRNHETAADQTAAKTEKSTASKESSETEGMPVLRKILLGIMAVMILILIALLVALRIKEKKHANKYR